MLRGTRGGAELPLERMIIYIYAEGYQRGGGAPPRKNDYIYIYI
jgi:hypothetical protein